MAEVRDNPDEHRFELLDDGKVAGVAVYRRRAGTPADTIVFVHTEVDPAFEGRGIGSMLAKGALDAAHGAGDRIVVECPFIAAYIDHHPEYRAFVDAN
jgi:predicted GNAT family acetyltransferase